MSPAIRLRPAAGSSGESAWCLWSYRSARSTWQTRRGERWRKTSERTPISSPQSAGTRIWRARSAESANSPASG